MEVALQQGHQRTGNLTSSGCVTNLQAFHTNFSKAIHSKSALPYKWRNAFQASVFPCVDFSYSSREPNSGKNEGCNEAFPCIRKPIRFIPLIFKGLYSLIKKFKCPSNFQQKVNAYTMVGNAWQMAWYSYQRRIVIWPTHDNKLQN